MARASAARVSIAWSRHEFSCGGVLTRAEAPDYFTAIEQERVIAAADAHTDPRTRDFQESYLAPRGIGAMLDVPLRAADRVRGVLCAEHVGGPARLDGGRTELRGVGRQPRRRWR